MNRMDYEKATAEEVDATVAALADLRDTEPADWCGAEESAQRAIDRLLAAVDLIAREYHYMLRGFSLATAPVGGPHA